MAQTNSSFHQLNNVKFIQSDLFTNLDPKEKFDIIVANPPYVSQKEYKNLAEEVKKQPSNALLAPLNGYSFYTAIFQKSPPFLAPKFLLALEIGFQQKEKMLKLIIEHFPKTKVSIFPDGGNYSRAIIIENG